jgi:acyl-coenzyme A synthetase/AMP-(fatty) acid ligase
LANGTSAVIWQKDERLFWFIGRADDIIKPQDTGGTLEVESTLMRHPAAEAAVMESLSPIGELVKKFVVLKTEETNKMRDGHSGICQKKKWSSRKKLNLSAFPKTSRMRKIAESS